MSYVPITRSVEIIHDPMDPHRPWVAVDHRTRAPVLRLAHRDQLLEICVLLCLADRCREGDVAAVTTDQSRWVRSGWPAKLFIGA
jgi:hypothetical protein